MRSLSHVALICLSLHACAPECEEPSFSERGATFLVSRISLGDTSAPMAAGFDLDGVTSLGEGPRCVDAPDHLLAPEGDLAGIDNDIAVLSPAMEELIVDRVEAGDPLGLEAAVRRGDILLVLEVVPSIDGVEEPTLRVHHATPADGSLELDPMGRPAAGQRFRGTLVAQGPLALVPTSSSLPRRSVAVLEPFAATSQDPSPAPPLDLAQLTHVGLNQCSGAGPQGRIGGSWAVDDAATWGRRLGLETQAEFLAAVVRDWADLEPDPRDATKCARISVGFALDLVPAELVVD